MLFGLCKFFVSRIFTPGQIRSSISRQISRITIHCRSRIIRNMFTCNVVRTSSDIASFFQTFWLASLNNIRFDKNSSLTWICLVRPVFRSTFQPSSSISKHKIQIHGWNQDKKEAILRNWAQWKSGYFSQRSQRQSKHNKWPLNTPSKLAENVWWETHSNEPRLVF